MSAAAHDRDNDDFLTIVDDIWSVLEEIARALDGQPEDESADG